MRRIRGTLLGTVLGALAALSVTRSRAPAAVPVRSSTGTRQTSTFATVLAKTMRPDTETLGLRSTDVPDVSGSAAPASLPVSGAMGMRQTFELSAFHLIRRQK